MKLFNYILLAVALMCSSAFACSFEYETDYVSKDCGAYQRDFRKYFDEKKSDYKFCSVFVHYTDIFSDPEHFAQVKVVIRCRRDEPLLPANINGFQRHPYLDTEVLEAISHETLDDLLRGGVYTYVREYSYEESERLSEAE